MKNKKINIAIDGFSSCGKSTLAKRVADALGYLFIDSGAMYRAITLYFIRQNIDLDNKKEVEAAIKNIQLEIIPNHTTGLSDILLNGENVSFQIREMTVAELVSNVAAIKEVRGFAVQQQQNIGSQKGVVMDGRDIGTVVFPNAELKIYLTADPSVRVKRRFNELSEINPNITMEEVQANLEMRDYIDSNREESPLTKANDAIVVDNTYLTKDETLERVLDLAKQQIELLNHD